MYLKNGVYPRAVPVGASLDHYLRAYDLATGQILWKADLPTSANSVPMTYQVRPDGRDRVLQPQDHGDVDEPLGV